MWILRNSGEKKFHKFGTFLCFICYLSLNKNAKVGLKKEKILIGSSKIFLDTTQHVANGNKFARPKLSQTDHRVDARNAG